MKKLTRNILIILLILILLVIVLFVGVVLYDTVTEYKPDDIVEADIVCDNESQNLQAGQELTVMTWNIGYSALGEYADFFMDGGSSVESSSQEQVEANLAAFVDEISSINPDLIMLQEVDIDSKRSYHINQADYLANELTGYEGRFAYNYKVEFVPYPVPPIGKVASGVFTLSRFDSTEAVREALPCPFGYPVRVGNLKRCLLVERIPVEGTDAELVLINLHLEAYDDGEGKIAQTKQLYDLIANEIAAGNYVIAGGDFNQEFSNVDTSSYPVFEGRWQPGQIEAEDLPVAGFYMDPSVPTCRSLDQPLTGADINNFQFYMIDGFIVSNNVTVTSVETQDLSFVNSDHNPVVMTVTLD